MTPAEPGPACGACGATGPPGARFCPYCGAAVAAAPVAERKQVTAMFVDVVASMALAERLGDERWREVLDGFLAAATAAVHAVEGTVHQFTGDGIMALFGAPVAQEDHARRGCLAALDLHARLGPLAAGLAGEGVALGVRVGLHSGEVIVGAIGDDRRADWAAIGHATGVAKRMESLAPPGSTAVSAATARLAGAGFDLAELGTHAVKGMRGPQRVLELRGRTGGPAAGPVTAGTTTAGPRAALVGRAAERRLLDGALRRALDGDGRVVVLTGEPGVGKSRLVAEFAAACAAAGVATHQVAAEPHGRRLPLRPALALLRSLFGVATAPGAAAARAAVAERLRPLGPDLAADLPLLVDVLGVPDPDDPPPQLDPDGRQRLLLAFLTRLLRAVTATRPLVLICEDVHWFDDASRGYLAELARAAAGTRAVVVVTTRPEHAAGDLTGPHVQRVTLPPLAPAEVRTLLAGALGTDPSLRGLAERIADRAGGNPFFCEELVAALRADGRLAGAPGAYRLLGPVADLALPATVQATIAARLDRLDAPAKLLLRDAAVVGVEFAAELVADLAGLDAPAAEPVLRDLVAAELIAPAGPGRYAFRHPLTREVAYRAQLDRRRRALHARVAEALAAPPAGPLDEQAALIAHHWAAADRPAAAAHWHTRAARWAERTSPRMGMAHWRAALRLADAAGADPSAVRLAVAARAGVLNQSWRVGTALDDLRAVHNEGVALLDRAGGSAGADGPALRLALDWGLFANLIFTGHERAGLPIARRNLVRAVDIGDPALVLTAAAGAAYAAFLVGRVAEAITAADRGLAAAGGDVTVGAGLLMANPYAFCLMLRAVCTCLTGEVTAAGRDLRRALDLAEAHAAPEMATYARWGLALVHSATGDPAAALTHARAALTVAERAGNAWGQAMAHQALAWAHLGAGELAAAERACRAGLATISTGGIGQHWEPVLRTARAAAALGAGRVDEAVAEAGAAATEARDRGLSWAEVPARIAQANALLAAGRTAEAAAACARGRTLAAATGIRLYDRALRSAGRRCAAAPA